MTTPITKPTNNLYASEVYRELERRAVKKGFFKQTESETIKLAAQQISQNKTINEEIDTVSTSDFVQDVSKLAYAIRRKGFVTLADDLEKNLMMYKTAECELYNVTVETNKDFFDFAHKGLEQNPVEGMGDLGEIETIQDAADKILAVVKKQPTGKLPKEASISELASWIKISQISDEEAENTYPAQIKNDLVIDFKPVKEQLAKFPDLSTVAGKAQISFAKLVGPQSKQWVELWISLGGADPSKALNLLEQITSLGIDVYDQTGQSFHKYITNGQLANLPNIYKLSDLLGVDKTQVTGVYKVLVNGVDKTNEAQSLSTNQKIVINPNSFLIANVLNNGDVKFTWPPKSGQSYDILLAQKYRTAFWYIIQSVIGGMVAINNLITTGLITISGISKLVIKIPDDAVDENGRINKDIMFGLIQKIKNTYDTITLQNKSLLSTGIGLGAPDTYKVLKDWQDEFYSTLNQVQQTIADKVKIPMVNTESILKALKQASKSWENTIKYYQDLRESDKVMSSRENKNNIDKLIKSLNGIGIKGMVGKPKTLFETWLNANNFSNIDDVISFSNSAINMANEQFPKGL